MTFLLRVAVDMHVFIGQIYFLVREQGIIQRFDFLKKCCDKGFQHVFNSSICISPSLSILHTELLKNEAR